jgi:hypothetical protein
LFQVGQRLGPGHLRIDSAGAIRPVVFFVH